MRGARRSKKISPPCGKKRSARPTSKPRRSTPNCSWMAQLTERLPANAVLCADTGMSTPSSPAARVHRGMKTAISGTLATMGPAVSYALAAKFAFPDRPAIALVGDGAMQMLGMNGLITAAKYRRWSDPRLIVLVLNNRDLNMVSWELRALGPGQNRNHPRPAGYRLCGAGGNAGAQGAHRCGYR